MKIESIQYHDERGTFAASFDDGMIIILDNKLDYHNMLSTGLDSYFIRKGKWPSGKNLDNRVLATRHWITKNKNRYKKWQPAHDQTIIKE